jgi:uncharacterized protein YbbK (DUF523 family)
MNHNETMLARLRAKTSSASPCRIVVNHTYEVKLVQHCPHCGHKLELPKEEVKLVRGFSYEQKESFVKKEKEPKKEEEHYRVVKSEGVEL